MALLPFLISGRTWQTGDFPAPWAPDRQSIHDHLKALEARGVDPNREDLPDSEAANAGRSFRFAPGAFDNLFGSDDVTDAVTAVNALRTVLRRPDARAIATLYDLLLDGAITIVDPAIEQLSAEPPPADRFAAFFDWLVRQAPDREPVKFALAMLGMLDSDRFEPLFMLFGRHEEFTKYAAVAVSNALPEDTARDRLETLARAVEGWGRIDLVSRLAADAGSDFRHWLVREGFRNTVMDEYLAYTAATDGRLLDQLAAPGAEADDALLDGAAGIFVALVAGGPAEDMADYADGAAAARLWLELVAGRPPTLDRGLAAVALLGCARRTTAPSDDAPPVWSTTDSTDIERHAAAYLARSELADLTLTALRDGEGGLFWMAQKLAPAIGIDPWPFAFDRQARETDTQDHWYDLMQTNDPDRIGRVLDLAIDRLPLDALATGPDLLTGLGPDWHRFQALDFIVQELQRFPGKGWPLIRAALRSPVIRNRNMAVRALTAWDKSDWPPDAVPLLRQATRDEPDDDVRDQLDALLKPG
ncbi:hypothetical protein [Marimonas arenosa]|uniref:HEAT repeat protein n=1 Tax=Marimonas arenosa TaxID=1795305 RepID=A0AAE3WBA3_9RHOB|nr:hypothetical protein [Marimonas arenosa]MDQ2088468.1 hypothetical protein [Marimonas arenosa]